MRIEKTQNGRTADSKSKTSLIGRTLNVGPVFGKKTYFVMNKPDNCNSRHTSKADFLRRREYSIKIKSSNH